MNKDKEVVLSIDYELFAEAIVKAQSIANKQLDSNNTANESIEYNSFSFSKFFRLLTIKKSDIKGYNATLNLFKSIGYIFFRFVSYLSLIMFILFLCIIIHYIINFDLLRIFTSILLSISFILFYIIFKVVSFEVDNLNDFNILINLISLIIALCAFIVSICSLFR